MTIHFLYSVELTAKLRRHAWIYNVTVAGAAAMANAVLGAVALR